MSLATPASPATGRPHIQPSLSLCAGSVGFGREIGGDVRLAEEREWLVTNGIGGFASGTVAGLATRRYHGVLTAALKPPLGRTLLVAKLDEDALVDGHSYPLYSNRWAAGTMAPDGCPQIERFHLEGLTPVWTFALEDQLVEKRIAMRHGANATFVRYELVRGSRPVRLFVKALVNYRDYHGTTHGDGWTMSVEPVDFGLRVTPFEGAQPYFVLSTEGEVELAHVWHRGFFLSQERRRGLDSQEDHLHAGTLVFELHPGRPVTLVATTDFGEFEHAGTVFDANRERETGLLARFLEAVPGAGAPPAWIAQLALAADQFIVTRQSAGADAGKTVIAGYPWFGDWGRDTMISLPGLALSTGRADIAREVLVTFARYVDRGMVPNRFPDADEQPEYNTADASLWYFEAARHYLETTGDTGLIAELFPALTGIVDWHERGTRYGIRMDPRDGLLYAGEPGVQLTWMDAKIGDWVVTPRTGKPIEINALWLNALATQARFAALLGHDGERYAGMAARARQGFQRFWNPDRGHCFDVIDGPEGDDPKLRPNQLFAVSLPESGLTADQQRAVVDICARRLLTSFGLRSLGPEEPDYVGAYAGDPVSRDSAYHQGTTWSWLLGPFVEAWLKVYGDPETAASFLEPIASHLNVRGLGSISEIFDGDAPFVPKGAFAQAWSVAEVLRVWRLVERARAARLAG